MLLSNIFCAKIWPHLFWWGSILPLGASISAEEVGELSDKAKELRSSFDDTAPTANTIAIEKRLEKLEKVVFEKTKRGSETEARGSETEDPTKKSSDTTSEKSSAEKKPTKKPSKRETSSKPHSDSSQEEVNE